MGKSVQSGGQIKWFSAHSKLDVPLLWADLSYCEIFWPWLRKKTSSGYLLEVVSEKPQRFTTQHFHSSAAVHKHFTCCNQFHALEWSSAFVMVVCNIHKQQLKSFGVSKTLPSTLHSHGHASIFLSQIHNSQLGGTSSILYMFCCSVNPLLHCYTYCLKKHSRENPQFYH